MLFKIFTAVRSEHLMALARSSYSLLVADAARRGTRRRTCAPIGGNVAAKPLREGVTA